MKIHVKHVTQIPISYIEEDNVYEFEWHYGFHWKEWKYKWLASVF